MTRLMALVTTALMALIAPAHSFCIDESVACELHELNNNLQRQHEDAQWEQLRRSRQEFWGQVNKNNDEWFAMISRWQDEVQRELENAKTPEELELARKHHNRLSEIINARARAMLGH